MAGFFEVVVAAGFLVVSATVADVGLLVAVPVLFAGLLAVTAEELLSCLLVEGFDVSEEVSDELSCLSEVSEDEPLSEEAVSCDTVSAEDTADDKDELSVDTVLLSALQPQADIISAAHSNREMIRFFIFLFLFHFRLPAVNVIRQDLYSITIRLYYTNAQKSRPNFSYFAFRDYEQLERSRFITYSQNSRTSLAKLT